VRMNSMERVLSALSFKETDRVPLFLLLSFYGAKELGVSIKEYFKHPEWILEAQKRFRKKFSNDCFYGFLYAAAEIEAWGGEVVFAEDGPPNSGAPFLRIPEMTFSLEPPRIDESPSLLCQRTVKMSSLSCENGTMKMSPPKRDFRLNIHRKRRGFC
ncbi:MAG: uroporphyrinogen decarboxylase family protein, partial [Thermovirgaceae bacterium]|nr:uroporphyrinogen decarboxylase family protein [Thermovirgaceae bacterium]